MTALEFIDDSSELSSVMPSPDDAALLGTIAVAGASGSVGDALYIMSYAAGQNASHLY